MARLLFVSATMRLLDVEGPSNEMAAFTIVPSDTHFSRGSLSDLDVSSFKGRISRAINSTCAGMVIAAVEVALNQTHDSKRRIRWVPHVHGLVVVPHLKKFKRQLKVAYPKSDAVPRPIKITKWDGDSAWLSYCFSLNFDGRVVRQQAVRFDKATQTERICRTTSSRRLSADEFVELVNFLDIQPLEARLLLRKAQLRYSSEQPKLVPIGAGL